MSSSTNSDLRGLLWRNEFTLEGGVFYVLLCWVGWMAWSTGSPSLSVIASTLGALAGGDLLLGWLNLKDIRGERSIQGEVFADQQAHGRMIIRNDRGLGSSWAIRIWESGQIRGEGRSSLLSIGSRQYRELDATWFFPQRGEQVLDGLILESLWPFGLVRRRRWLRAREEVLVYPAIGSGAPTRGEAGSMRLQASMYGHGIQYGFQGIREYRSGDPIHWIHWPTTARTGKPMVVQRPDFRSDEIVVEVEPHDVLSWDEVIEGACAQVLRSLAAGLAVGLSVSGSIHSPRRGSAWRRHLLAELAIAPEPSVKER